MAMFLASGFSVCVSLDCGVSPPVDGTCTLPAILRFYRLIPRFDCGVFVRCGLERFGRVLSS